MPRIYLDYASTTPVDPQVARAMLPYFTKKFGNPGAMHGFGQEAQAAIDDSRQKIADFFGCDFKEIIFTGSATESNNLAIGGIVKNVFMRSPSLNVREGAGGVSYRKFVPHIITSKIEHKSILETCRDLEKQGLAEVTYLPVIKDGFVRPEDVRKSIKQNTVLVSIIYVNNEIGTIQAIAEIAKVIRSAKRFLHFVHDREQNDKIGGSIHNSYPILHTDAVQALNYLDCNVKNLGVDLLTFSGHKIYGPKGIGGLFVKKGTPITPIITGGNQEFGVRSGTENTPYIVGFAKAIEIAKKMRDRESKRVQKLRDYFIAKVLAKISAQGGSAPGGKIAELNGSRENRIANNANFLFRGIDANKLLIALDQAGIAASSGSTCTIKTVTPSEVLLALGRTAEEAKQSIRFTLGRGTTKQDIDYATSVFTQVIRK